MVRSFKPRYIKKKKNNKTNNFSINSVKILNNHDSNNSINSDNDDDNYEKPLIEYKIDFEKKSLIIQNDNINNNNDNSDDDDDYDDDDDDDDNNEKSLIEYKINFEKKSSIIQDDKQNYSIENQKKEKKEKKDHVVIPFDLSVQLLQNYIQENEIVDKNLIFFAISNKMIEDTKNGVDIKSIDLTNGDIKNEFIESQLFIVQNKLESINKRFQFINFKKNDKLKIIKSKNFNNISYNDYQSININNNQIHVYLIDSILEKFQ